jgi:hypothetical protein
MFVSRNEGMPHLTSDFLLAVKFKVLNTAKRKQGLKKRKIAIYSSVGLEYIHQDLNPWKITVNFVELIGPSIPLINLEIMRINLSEKQYEYLHAHIPENLKHLTNLFKEESVNTGSTVDVQEDIANEIRDWAMERQQKVGFDINYRLTSEGQLLQELIDLFFE